MMRYCIVLLALVLASCRNPQNGTPEVMYNCSANAVEVAALEKEIPEFEKSTGVRIKLNPFSGDEKLIAMIAAGQAPDIFYTNNVLRDRFASEGHLMNMKSIPGVEEFLKKIRPADVTRSISVDGGLYAISNWTFTCGVYFNRKVFDEKHLPYPDSSWTWDDMVRAARRLTTDSNGDGKVDRYGIFIGSHFIEAFELMNHAPIRSDELYLSISREAQDVYRRYLSLMEEGLMPDIRRVQAMGMQAPQMLESGRVAMLVEAVPNISLYETLSIDWGVAPLPGFGTREPRYFRAASGGLSISASTNDTVAAFRALQWLITQAQFYQPNPVIAEADFVNAWEKKYPQLKGRGVAEVWRLSELHDGGDPRYFVRFSSWTSHAILEQLQPMLDRLWIGDLTIDELVSAIPSINERVKKELQSVLLNPNILPSFRIAIERAIASAK